MIISIGIVGQGFVGTAVRERFRPFFTVRTYDVRHGTAVYRGTEEVRGEKPSDPARWVLENVDGPAFLCLPTPMQRDRSSDTSIIEKTVQLLNNVAAGLGRRAVATIKSTVPLGTTDRLNAGCRAITVCFNPKFL